MLVSMQIKRLCFPVTLRCNLRCKLCAERSPYYKNPYHPSLGELIGEADALFQIIGNIDNFDITGGEPLLRKDLPDFIAYMHNKYRERIGKLRITTNGTLLPSVELRAAMQEWAENGFIIVDKYQVSDKSEQVVEILQLSDIPCQLRNYSNDLHCDGWVDYGDLSLKHNNFDARNLFNKCAVPKLGFFTCITNGRIFPCVRARLLYENNIADVSMNAFDPELTINGKIARLNALLGDEVVEACKYCNGLCGEGERFVPAEQLNLITPHMTASEVDKEPPSEIRMIIYTQAYNAEQTVARTIESVLHQTCGNFKYFIIDNGSTDKTRDIILSYAENDDRIIPVICEKNDILVLPLLRNTLIELLKTEGDISKAYFFIVDADDAIREDFLQSVNDVRLDFNDPDMIISGFRHIDARTGETMLERYPDRTLLVKDKSKADDFFKWRRVLLSQWGKVYKVSFLFKPIVFSFPEMLRFKENLPFGKIPKWYHTIDTVYLLDLLYAAQSAVFIAKPLYDFTYHPKSAFNVYYPERGLVERFTFQVYRSFLSQFGEINKFNSDYCYAIYRSLIDYTLAVILNSAVPDLKQKLSDVLNILRADETVAMLMLEADPVFNNLKVEAKRDFLTGIQRYLQDSQAVVKYPRLVSEIAAELSRYNYLNVEDIK